MYRHKWKQSLANKQGKEQTTYGSHSFLLYTAQPYLYFSTKLQGLWGAKKLLLS